MPIFYEFSFTCLYLPALYIEGACCIFLLCRTGDVPMRFLRPVLSAARHGQDRMRPINQDSGAAAESMK